jgi:hypothetical protein
MRPWTAVFCQQKMQSGPKMYSLNRFEYGFEFAIKFEGGVALRKRRSTFF